ncbi:2,4-dienoyl-CoA reductase [Amycolatopsis marina]|uniref:2,4-dienoyl-CoA reductase n=1 Tax=Amycolatopsis marina TaxID=490629 RepID=A0A1I1B6L7_9PSEU|nr:NADH:flavin oxidoreductase [Amycolatopsis marina]SFB44358.1 2,4-dienoyl-CoA reductase [Amycolatopsis marina]
MTTSSAHPALRQISIRDTNLPNRLVVAPMTRVSATEDGTPTEVMAEYYESFAHGGFALVITEGIYTDADYSQGYPNQPGLVTEAHVAAWRQVTRRVHREGGRIVAQLMHAGALSQGNHHLSETAGPSSVAPRGQMMPEYGGSGSWPLPREMTSTEISRAVSGFAAAARNAERAGFDGVEVHAANGYLLDQFLTDYTNRRTDGYGGPVRNRVRLAAETVAAICSAVPEEFWVGIRLSQTKVNDFEYRWPGGAGDAEIIFSAVAAAGADYLHVASEGRNWIDTARLDNGETLTALARKVSNLPVIANGGMHQVEQAARVLDEGHADLLALGRAALADPELPLRLAEGAAPFPFDPGMLHPKATLDNTRRWRERNSRPAR